MIKDDVVINDRLILTGEDLNLITPETSSKEVVQINGFFKCHLRERGKIVPGSLREGSNIWTLTGREYLAQLMSYSAPSTPYRTDRINYFGFGTGSTAEVAGVSALVTPIAYTGTTFLASIGTVSFPLSPTRTTVKYSKTYSETELSIVGSVVLTEAGLFTDGSSLSSYTPGTRDVTLANASLQAPCAYKSFEALKKTQNFSLEVSWEIRF